VAGRRGLIVGGVCLALALAVVWAARHAVEVLRGEIVAALGPGATIGSLDMGPRRLTIEELMLPGGEKWPADAALRTQRVTVTPNLLTLLSPARRSAAVDVATPYVAMVRTRRGRLRIVPTLLDDPDPPEPRRARKTGKAKLPGPAPSRDTGDGAAAGATAPPVITLAPLAASDGEIDFYDASAATPPWRIRLVGLDARFDSLAIPTLAGRTPLDVRATIDGPARDGTVDLGGWIERGTREIDVTATLRGVDLLAFRPYVAGRSKVKLAGGTFDLDLRAKVEQGRLTAPGRVVLRDLAFAPGGRGTDLVLGVPRDVLLAALAQQGQIAFDFRLDGDVNDPRFSLNEQLAARLALGVMGAVGGLDVRGLVRGVEGLGAATIEGTGGIERGLGEALKRFRGR
jgi:hypothetical protein